MTILKPKILMLLIFLSSTLFSLNAEEKKFAKTGISVQEWNEDLDYLVKRMEVTHPDLYASVSREDFNASIVKLKENLLAKTDTEIVLELIKLLAMFKDGHTSVDPAKGSLESISSLFTAYPFKAYFFSDGLYLISLPEQYKDLSGRKIIKIGNCEVDDAVKKLAPYVSADNQSGIISKLPILLTIKELLDYEKIKDSASSLKLLLEDSTGKQSELTLDPIPLMKCFPQFFLHEFPEHEKQPLWLSKPDDNYYFQTIEDGKVLYLQINSMQEKADEKFAAFCSRMFKYIDEQKIGSMIIDVRLNTGGQHFEMPLLTGIIARPELNKKGNLFLLTGRVTFSASQHLTTQLSRYTNVLIIGESTSGKPNHYGNPKLFRLNNSGLGIKCSFVLHQDSQPGDYNITTEPDIWAALASKDYFGNTDPVLLKALSFDKYKNIQPDLVKKLTAVYKENGLSEFKKSYFAAKPDLLKTGLNLEKLLYHELDTWMAANRKNNEEYIEYLKFMLQEIPGSVNINLDLADWLKTRDQQEAIRYYRQALQINPACKAAKIELMLIQLNSVIKNR